MWLQWARLSSTISECLQWQLDNYHFKSGYKFPQGEKVCLDSPRPDCIRWILLKIFVPSSLLSFLFTMKYIRIDAGSMHIDYSIQQKSPFVFTETGRKKTSRDHRLQLGRGRKKKKKRRENKHPSLILFPLITSHIRLINQNREN